MKKIFFPFLFCLPALVFAGNPTSDSQETNNESTKISLYVPGFLIKMGSWFVNEEKDPEVKSALSKIRSTSIVVREGCAYKEYHADKKYDRKMSQLKRQDFEELLTIADDGEKVTVQLRQNKKGTIRQVVVMVDDGSESFVFLRLRCNLQMNDIKRLMQDEDIGGKVNNMVTI